MIRSRRFVRVLCGLVLMALGAAIWSSRLTTYPTNLDSLHSTLQFEELRSGVNLESHCQKLDGEPGSWMLFILQVSLQSDNRFRGYFQTSDDGSGVFLEYDPGEQALLRLGLGNPTNATRTRIRTVRQNEEAMIAIGVRRSEVRIVMNAVDRRIPWPEVMRPMLGCDAVVVGAVGDDDCGGCTIDAHYATGASTDDLQNAMDEISNVVDFNVRRWLGTGLSMAGLVVVFMWRHRPRIPLDSDR